MKKKVAIIIPSLRGGGAERVMINIAKYLKATDKYRIRLLIINKVGQYEDILPKDSIEIVDLNTQRVRNSMYRLVKELNTFRPDVVLSTLGHLNLVVLIIRKLLISRPRIVIREANTLSRDLTKHSAFKRRFFLFMYKKLYPCADIIVSQCEEMKHDLIKLLNISDKKIKTIYNPLDIEYIKKKSKEYNPYNKNGCINIVSAGRLSHQKGFDVLLRAFSIVKKSIPNVHLTILGDGKLKKSLINTAVQLDINDSVSFVGFKINPYPFFYYADLFVLASRWEGFPNTLLEAMACGVKVLSTECQSGPKEIIGDSEYGFLVRVDDPINMAEGIIQSLNSMNKTGNRADVFDIKNLIKEYEEVLH